MHQNMSFWRGLDASLLAQGCHYYDSSGAQDKSRQNCKGRRHVRKCGVIATKLRLFADKLQA